MNSGLKVGTKKPTKTWDELGIKGEQYKTARNLGWTRDLRWAIRNPLKPGMISGLKVSNTKPTKTWDELGIKGEH